jgi:uncharacterized protein Yka (UPF0111/DUF47 family)
MAGQLSLILQIIAALLPLLKKDEWAELKKEIKKLEEEHDKTKQAALAALQSGDLAALNIIIGKLLEL